MAKNIRRMLAMALVMCMFVSALPMQALAAEGDPIIETETVTDGGLTTEITTTTTQTKDDETGNVTVTVEIQKDTTGTTAEGATLEGQETNVESQTRDENHVIVGEYGMNEGHETITDIIPVPEDGITVEVPGTVGEANTETFGDTSNNGIPSGDINTPEGQITTDVTPGEVTVTTTEKTFTEIIDTENTDLEYVTSDTTPNGENDLTYTGGDDTAPEEYLPGYEGEPVPPEGVDGYDYVYVGSGNTSMLVPAIVFDKPLSDEDKLAMYGENAYIKDNSITYYYVKWLKEEDKARIAYDENGKYVTDAEGYILDKEGNRIFKEERTEKGPNGETTYLHRFDNYGSSLKVEGWYEGGWVKELNGKDGFYAVWAGPQQFTLVDKDGNPITTYCADNATPTQNAFGYNVENLEDATYYTEEEAKQIRSIALNGYWGTVGNETDAEGNEILDENGKPIPKVGSLEAMKASLLASGKFTEADLEALTDGVALTATQMAIWANSNKMSGIKFINAHYSEWGAKDGLVPEDKKDEVDLMFRLYDYLMALAPTEVQNTTADTIINADNFVSDMSVTVVKKAEEHTNNADTNTDNDAYVTNLTFALVVKPSTENGDDLVVTVVDAHGNEIARGRIAGEAKDGERVLVADDLGNYCFEGITMIEGEQNFKLNLTGIQHLQEGVYLYTSEVREDTSSQTLVGLASGDRGVNVTMDIKFDLDVQEGVVATERVWHYEYDPEIPEPPVPAEEPPVPAVFRLNNDGLEEIPEEPVPLATPVITGDNSGLWIAVVLLSIFAMAAINLSDKKRQLETF